MSTVPSGEAGAANKPKQDGAPNRPSQGSHGQGPLPEDVPPASGMAVSAEQQTLSQAPSTLATSADKDTKPDVVPERGKEKPEEVAATPCVPRPPGALQTSVSLNHTAWDRPPQQHQDTKTTQSLLGFQRSEKETPQTGGVPERQAELAPTTLSAEAQSPQHVEVLPALLPAGQPPADTQGQPDAPAASSGAAGKEEPEEPQAWKGEPEEPQAWKGEPEEPQGVMAVNPAASSKDPWVWSFPPTPVGSAPPSPGSPDEAVGRRRLDPSLFAAAEENGYMRSMTSLLGGGEGAISSLADVLVWSDASMGMATDFLGSGHGSVSDLLHSSGPGLRSVSSLLGGAGSAFSSGLAAGTGSALRSVTSLLGAVERRALERMRSAARFLTGLLAPRRAPAGSSCD